MEYMGYPVIVTKAGAAFLAACPHKGRPLHAEDEGDGLIECQFHHAAFDAATGEMVRPPLSKTPCQRSCRLTRILLDEGGRPMGHDGPLYMPELPPSRGPGRRIG